MSDDRTGFYSMSHVDPADSVVIRRSGMVADEAELIRERDAWREIAAQHLRNEQYYRGLVVQIGEMLGAKAYIQDDGGQSQDVLCAKVPELVQELISECFP
jgi:hypothetical protein